MIPGLEPSMPAIQALPPLKSPSSYISTSSPSSQTLLSLSCAKKTISDSVTLPSLESTSHTTTVRTPLTTLVRSVTVCTTRAGTRFSSSWLQPEPFVVDVGGVIEIIVIERFERVLGNLALFRQSAAAGQSEANENRKHGQGRYSLTQSDGRLCHPGLLPTYVHFTHSQRLVPLLEQSGCPAARRYRDRNGGKMQAR